MMAERGVSVDHATVHRWSIEILSVLAAMFRRRKRSVGLGWRMDETDIKVAGQCKYLYRAVDRTIGRSPDSRSLTPLLRQSHRGVGRERSG